MGDDTSRPDPVRARTVNVIGRQALVREQGGHRFGDFYHRAMQVSWPQFFAGAATIFLSLNSLFALAYVLGEQPVANVRPGSVVDLFFFSVETLATVGFGDMHPQTTYGHIIATMEIFTGMSFIAVMTGLIFTRFSRPQARLVFARNPVVGQHDGQQTLMIRVANTRANMLSNATAQLWLVRNERAAEGGMFRRFHRLALHRQENPVFVLSWTLLHAIDQASPVYGQTAQELAAADAIFVLILSGLDENSMQELRARQMYDAGTVRWGHRYVDILAADSGEIRIDYAKFHEVVAEGEEPSLGVQGYPIDYSEGR